MSRPSARMQRVLVVLTLCMMGTPAQARLDVLPNHPALADRLRRDWAMQLHVKEDLDRKVPVVVRVGRGATPAELARLEAGGVEWERLNGTVARVGPYLGARVNVPTLHKLLAAPFVERVFSVPKEVRPAAPGNPFNRTWGWTGVESVWARPMTPTTRTQGQGVVLCDLDGAMDVFHPLFFRADAGLYAWLDLNGNNRLDPGVDAVDLDGNGVPGVNERVRLLGGELTDPTHAVVSNTPFHPAQHFLFADVNQNTQRDYGAASGFTEQTPAYGEPLFVADDVNNNGVVDAGEKLRRLGTSKIKGVYRPSTGLSYERGTNLVQTPVLTDTLHGNGVAGILVGGVPGTTWVQGLAPEADLLGIVQDAAPGELGYETPQFQANRIAALNWAIAHGTRIFVHEYGQAVAEPADGSSDWEGVLDQLLAQGTVQATAAHNFAGNNGRTRLTLAPGQAVDLPLQVLDYVPYGYNIRTVMGTLRWRGAASDVSVAVRTVDGNTLDASIESQVGRDVVFGSGVVSPRGTGMVNFTYAHLNAAMNDYENLQVGAYNVHVTNTSAQPRDVYVYLTDDTSYAFFVNVVATRDDTSSMAHPSTADSAIVVGAFRVNTLDHGETEGDLAYYSGRGPRIDGATSVAVASPADAYTASPVNGHYQVFDGTSGALPQVAAALALLLQKEPALNPAQVRARLTSSARADTVTGTVPNHAWGAGRLDVPNLLYGMQFAPNAPPTLNVNGPTTVVVPGQAALDVMGTMDDQDALASLRVRFDFDYDGSVDATTATASWPINTLGPHQVLVEVEDTQGLVSRRLLQVVGVTGGGSSSSNASSAGTSASSGAGSGASSSAVSTASSGAVSGASSGAVVSSGLASSGVASSVGASGSGTASSAGASSNAATSGQSSSAANTSSPASSSAGSSSVASAGSSAGVSSTSQGASSTAGSSASQPVSSSGNAGTSQVASMGASSTGGNASSGGGDGGDGGGGGCGNCANSNGGGVGLLVMGLWVLRRSRRHGGKR